MLSDLERLEIAKFAEIHGLSFKETMVLPGIFEKVAGVAHKSLRVVINWAIYSNPELAKYIVSLAKEVVENMGDEMDELIAQGGK